MSLGIHSILQHLESPGNYAKVLFIDCSSAFNTIVPSKLFYKLQNMGVQNSLCHWILDFLQQRTQVVKINNKLSQAKHISTGAPQGCVLSPLLNSLYTNDCISHSESVKMLKFADDTTLIGLISGDDDSAYRNEILSLTEWCSHHNLEVDFRRQRKETQPLSINAAVVERVDSFKFLGTIISSSLKWEDYITADI